MILTKNEIREACRRKLSDLSDDYLEMLIYGADWHGMMTCFLYLLAEERRRERAADQYASVVEWASPN